MNKLLILDFDGTLTNAEEEGKNYRRGYLEDIALLADIDTETVFAWAEELEQKILSNADQYGWNFNGKIVAPACVDPYLRIMPISRMIFDRVGVYTDLNERDRLLDRILYKYNYQKTTTAFRTGAADFFRHTRTLEKEPKEGQKLFTCVVTNSHTTPVQKKISLLGEQSGNDFDWLVKRVHGSARKYVIDESCTELSESLSIPNLSRPIYLRRKLYFDRIQSLQKEYGVSWKQTTVFGDIFELDLAVPLACGARVALMTNKFTPQYEKDFLHAHERGAVHSSLQEALNWIMNS
jgi:hydroxymethylpyrimidine pyrophosphatase-like HAD family hydrolase